MEKKYVLFELSDQYYGLEIDSVIEICEYQKPVTTPNSAYSLEGVINLRGKIVPTVNLKSRFNIECGHSPEKIIITQTEHGNMGLLVDRTVGIESIMNDSIKEVKVKDLTISKSFLKGMAIQQDKILMIIDEKKIITN